MPSPRGVCKQQLRDSLRRLVGAAWGNRHKSFFHHADADEGNQEGGAGTENPGWVRVFAGGGEAAGVRGALQEEGESFVGWDARREVVPRAERSENHKCFAIRAPIPSSKARPKNIHPPCSSLSTTRAPPRPSPRGSGGRVLAPPCWIRRQLARRRPGRAAKGGVHYIVFERRRRGWKGVQCGVTGGSTRERERRAGILYPPNPNPVWHGSLPEQLWGSGSPGRPGALVQPSGCAFAPHKATAGSALGESPGLHADPASLSPESRFPPPLSPSNLAPSPCPSACKSRSPGLEVCWSRPGTAAGHLMGKKSVAESPQLHEEESVKEQLREYAQWEEATRNLLSLLQAKAARGHQMPPWEPLSIHQPAWDSEDVSNFKDTVDSSLQVLSMKEGTPS
nr:PREDICTED: gastrin-releasing peptide [Bos mutus]